MAASVAHWTKTQLFVRAARSEKGAAARSRGDKSVTEPPSGEAIQTKFSPFPFGLGGECTWHHRRLNDALTNSGSAGAFPGKSDAGRNLCRVISDPNRSSSSIVSSRVSTRSRPWDKLRSSQDHASLLPIFRIAYGHSITCQDTSCGHATRTVRQYQQRASSFLTIRRPSTPNSYAAPHAQDMRSSI